MNEARELRTTHVVLNFALFDRAADSCLPVSMLVHILPALCSRCSHHSMCSPRVCSAAFLRVVHQLQDSFTRADMQHVTQAAAPSAEPVSESGGSVCTDSSCSHESTDSQLQSSDGNQASATPDAAAMFAEGKRMRSDTFRDAHMWYLRCITDETSFSNLGLEVVKDDPLQDCPICAQLPAGTCFVLCMSLCSNVHGHHGRKVGCP